tara:strand:+ start:1613 stop:2035 length:423 start_codon:yes stop_codon:yes gene_type:complete
MKVIIINGPNLNLLGVREKSIYGNISFKDYFNNLKQEFSEVNLEYFQSNIEGEIIDKLQEVGFNYDAILLNAGGYSHTSVSIADCIRSIESPVYEIHISNIYAREEFRRKSLLSEHCKAVISGFKLDSYKLTLYSLTNED